MIPYIKQGIENNEACGWFKRVDCNRVIETVLENLRLVIQESGMKITSDMLPDVEGMKPCYGNCFKMANLNIQLHWVQDAQQAMDFLNKKSPNQDNPLPDLYIVRPEFTGKRRA